MIHTTYEEIYATGRQPAAYVIQRDSYNKAFNAPTGGSFNVADHFAKSSGYFLRARSPEVTLQAVLDEISRGFGLNKSQLAIVLDSSRRAVNYWYNGQIEPNAEKMSRIEQLRSLASEWVRREPVNRIGKLKVSIQGTTLLQLIAASDLDISSIRALMSRIGADRTQEFHVHENAYAARSLRKPGRKREKAYPVYESDPNEPSRIIEIRDDGSKVSGVVKDGLFVAD